MDFGISGEVLKMGREETLSIDDKLGAGGQAFSCPLYLHQVSDSSNVT